MMKILDRDKWIHVINYLEIFFTWFNFWLDKFYSTEFLCNFLIILFHFTISDVEKYNFGGVAVDLTKNPSYTGAYRKI